MSASTEPFKQIFEATHQDRSLGQDIPSVVTQVAGVYVSILDSICHQSQAPYAYTVGGKEYTFTDNFTSFLPLGWGEPPPEERYVLSVYADDKWHVAECTEQLYDEIKEYRWQIYCDQHEFIKSTLYQCTSFAEIERTVFEIAKKYGITNARLLQQILRDKQDPLLLTSEILDRYDPLSE